MLSLDSAYQALVEAIAVSAQQKHYQTTTSLAPELGLREMAPKPNQRAYERHEGGRSLLLLWRQAETDLNRPGLQRHALTVILLEEGVALRRHAVEFDS